MFTGIIEELGYILAIEQYPLGARLYLQIPQVLEEMKTGQSLCVNGCCLTLVDIQSTYWVFDIVQETLKCTTLKYLKVGDQVNLEQAVRYQDRLNGHLVQGHVDGIGKILNKDFFSDRSWEISISTSPQLLYYMIDKGSIAIDGISLTIIHVQETSFSFAMIPHTAQLTTLGFKQIGDPVNLEVDMMAKYVERFVTPLSRNSYAHSH